MKITIIQIGKTKNAFFREAEEEYIKRLKPYARLEIITLKEASLESVHAADRELAKQKEAELIIKNLPKNTFCIVLDEKGEQMDSVQFSHLLERHKNAGDADITFIIGGPFGLTESVKKNAKKMLSFSRFTFTHEQIRVLLLEQLYRANMILAGRTYHY